MTMRALACSLSLVALASCAPAEGGLVVSAPSTPAAPSAPSPAAQERSSPGVPEACGEPWTIEGMADGPGRVVVVCGTDVRRADLDPASMTRAIAPALAPARDRVCECAARLRVPAHVDLVVTSLPEQGRATVQVSGADEDDVDPELGPPFASCIGTVAVSFAPLHPDACPSGEKPTLVYPVRVDLVR